MQIHNIGSIDDDEEFEVNGLNEFVEQNVDEDYQDEHFAHDGDGKMMRHIQK